jgi:hypothetical protein
VTRLTQAHRDRWLATSLEAMGTAQKALSGIVLANFSVSELTGRARQAVHTQWRVFGCGPGPAFDWDKIAREYREPDQLSFSVWVGDRLAAMALCQTTGASVKICFMEADPRPNCPLKSHRSLVVFEVAANYADARGKGKLTLEAVNSGLIALYRDRYGFSVRRYER